MKEVGICDFCGNEREVRELKYHPNSSEVQKICFVCATSWVDQTYWYSRRVYSLCEMTVKNSADFFKKYFNYVKD